MNVLDASAVLAYLKGEAGEAIVAEALDRGAVVGAADAAWGTEPPVRQIR